MKSLYNTIINEHFLAFNITTPTKVIKDLEGVLNVLNKFKEENIEDINKYDVWKKDYEEYLFNRKTLETKINKIHKFNLNLWEFEKKDMIVWPFKFILSCIIFIFIYPYNAYKDKEILKLNKEIEDLDNDFYTNHIDYDNFIKSHESKTQELLNNVINKFKIIFNKAIHVFNYKGMPYHFNERIIDVNETINLIENELIPYYSMINDVLYMHIHDVMSKRTILNYIKAYLNDSVHDIVFENQKEIEALRNKLSYNETLKLDGYQKDENIERIIIEKDWDTTLRIIKYKRST